MSNDKRIRLSLSVTTAVKDRLDRLLRLSDESENMTEVIRRSLSLYEER